MARGELFTNSMEAGAATEGAEPDPEQDTAEGASEWATAEPEVEECMQWVDWAGLSAAGVV